ncbi:ISL3 family transposase [Leptothoe sp. PORK10 BA2]|uniref:ISL3 family transposase n=1 Tax=Leptothoe sp. PORK10 BA2 TaxID=3110254 RepID=UPI002B21D354|nr:ISL3 family transposase [Leptothoe sp. PORK10 BA2]MEA5464772.1 ISL3 family transposase [Leptothoe sp. PORK10 BA2]
MDNSIHIPLDLPEVRVLETTKTEQGDWLIRVESTQPGTKCRQCGRQITHFHGFDKALRLRHLPLFEVPVFIELRPKRYRCDFCEGKPTTTQRLSWYQQRSPNTKAYEQWLLRMLINSTVSDVARTLNISDDIVTGVLNRWVTRQVNWDKFEHLGIVGIDEIALKRGHRDYVTLITTPLEPTGVEVLAVLGDRKKETVADFLASIPLRLKVTIKRVCTDMYQGFVGAVQAQLPWAKLVVDRFHVAKAYRGCADTVRKQEVKRLKQELSKAEYEQLKGAMWPFRKSPDRLKDEEQALLDRLFTYSPKLKQAYQLREELTQIFEGAYTKSGAKCAIRAWCKRVRKSGIEAFDGFLGTVETWLDKITNYFLEGLTSGFVEGFNNRVKVLKRRCYGIFDVAQIFQRLTLDINGYEQFAFT